MKIKLLCALILVCTLAWGIDFPQNSDLPMISVSVTGYVPAPGVYMFTPVSRLSDVISQQLNYARQAQEKTELIPETKPTTPRLIPPDQQQQPEPALPDYIGKQALRTVQLTRDGKTEAYDLLRFYRLGDSSQNPHLRDGDLVLVEAIKEVVELQGAVHLPGQMQYVKGDQVADLLSLAQGLEYDADPGLVQLYRYQPNHIDFTIKTLNLNSGQAGSDTALQPYDRLFIPRSALISKQHKVTISGQVKNPGEYIIGDNSTLYGVLMQAGGLNNRADVNNLICYNEYLNDTDMAMLDFLLQRSMSDMTPIEYSYLRTNLQQLKGKYSLEPAKMISSEGKEANPLLHDGDRIYIPEKLDMVWVSGQVKYPGLVPWVEGAGWDYYISQAGGYTNNRKAGKGRLIRGFSGNWVKPDKNIKIMAGDTIFIPSQTDRSLWTDVKDIVTLISSTITIIVGVQALTN